jgi:hypothetical protein
MKMISKKLVVAVIAITSICVLPYVGVNKAYATQRTVNNRTDLVTNPGQYTTITAAIAASPLNAGDTIIVAGSPISYGDVVVNKKVSIIGTGYNPQKQNTLSSIINRFDIQISGVLISGLNIILNQQVEESSIAANLSDVKIRNCSFFKSYNYAHLNINESTTNCEISNCFFNGGSYSFILNAEVGSIGIANNQNQTNLVITNNIFYHTLNDESIGRVGNSAGPEGGVTIKHNLFLRGSNTSQIIITNTAPAIINARNWVIQDNIFYNITPATAANTSNCSFINNISYAGDSLFTGYALPNIPPAGNTGSGNLNNTNPLFVAPFVTSTGSNPVWFDNWRLQAASPAKNTATDGTDRGPTGGDYPIYNATKQYLTGEPNVPQVYESGFTNGSAVQPNGTLQLQVKGRKID